MKKEAFAFLLLTVIMVLSLFCIGKLSNLTKELSLLADIAAEEAYSENWNNAEAVVENSIELLHQNDIFLHIILHHNEIDMLDSYLHNLLSAVYCRNPAGTKASAKLVKSNLESIRTAEELRIESIL